MPLNPEQQELNERRLKEHQHERYVADLDLGNAVRLNKFIVLPNVLRPEKTSAIYFGRYLAAHPELYRGRSVLDMGCGSGIQGIVAAMNGASPVVLSDIVDWSVRNTRENVDLYGLQNTCSVRRGDLFENVPESFDVVIFNQPFFDDKPIEGVPISQAIFDEGALIHRFFDDVKAHLNPEAILIMPFFHFAGTTNNPEVQAPRHGFKIVSKETIDVADENIQKGLFSVFVLALY